MLLPLEKCFSLSMSIQWTRSDRLSVGSSNWALGPETTFASGVVGLAARRP